MAFVLDSSVALAWLLPDEDSSAADALADRLEAEPAVVPAIWRLEVGNALLTARRRARLADTDLDGLVAAVIELPIEEDSYGAAYLELAERRAIPLATLDARLRAASAAAGVAVLP